MSKQQVGVSLTILGIAIPALIALVPGVIGYGKLQYQAAEAQHAADTADAKAQRAQDEVNRLPTLIQAEFRRHEQGELVLREDVTSIKTMLQTHMKGTNP